jgi:hypothetical protein
VYEAQFPFYSKILLQAPYAPSEYEALQTSLTKRLSHGLQITPGFTWSHAYALSVEDPQNPIGDNGWGQTGTPVVFTITGTYYIPSIKSPGQIGEGWQINSTVYMLAAGPTTATDAADDLSGLGGSGTDRWNILGNPHFFTLGGTGQAVPCYGIVGSSFSKATNCETVNTVAAAGSPGCATTAELAASTTAQLMAFHEKAGECQVGFSFSSL